MFFSSFFVLILNYYYQVQSYVYSLYDELNITVFFKNDVKDIKVLADEITKIEMLHIKELVDSSQSYLRALEKNPFLNDISSLDDNIDSIGGYAVVLPKEIFDENYFLKIRDGIESINGVDEVVFDTNSFKQYRKLKNLLMSCQKTFFSLFIIVGGLIVFKIIFAIFLQESPIKKLVGKFCFYFMAASIGFFIIWILSIYIQCDLSIDKPLISLVIPFATIFGLVVDNKL
jgi:cell division protein FtsX